MARKLRKCGAFLYCTLTLVAAAQFTTSQTLRLLVPLLETLQMMILTGDTDGNPTALTEGTKPWNVFL